MERIELLIAKVRENTNLTDKNGVKDSNVIRHFDHAQKSIQSIIQQAKLEPDLFVGTAVLTPEEVTADLPSDIFADNSILYVEPYGYAGRTLDKIQSHERAFKAGYFIENKTIGFSASLLEKYSSFTVKYFKRLPVLDMRRGKITARTSTTITLAVGFSTLIATLSDYVTVVDKDGVIIQSELPIISFDTGTGVITTEDLDTTLVLADHYVVCGKIASSHCSLPDECEPLLLDFVEKRILSKNASKETVNAASFSEEQKNLLLGLFADTSSDPVYPPITDTDFNF